MTMPTERQRLINMAQAHAQIDTAVDRISRAISTVRTEQVAIGMRPGGPVIEAANRALKEAQKAHALLWQMIKRMP
jgi:hypothetical protein